MQSFDVAHDAVRVDRCGVADEFIHRGPAAQLEQPLVLVPQPGLQLQALSRTPLRLGQLVADPAPGLHAHAFELRLNLGHGDHRLLHFGLGLLALFLKRLPLGLRLARAGEPALQLECYLVDRPGSHIGRHGTCQRLHLARERLGIAFDSVQALLQDLSLPQLVEKALQLLHDRGGRAWPGIRGEAQGFDRLNPLLLPAPELPFVGLQARRGRFEFVFKPGFFANKLRALPAERLLGRDNVANPLDSAGQRFRLTGRRLGHRLQAAAQCGACAIDVGLQCFALSAALQGVGRLFDQGSEILQPLPHFARRARCHRKRLPHAGPLGRRGFSFSPAGGELLPELFDLLA